MSAEPGVDLVRTLVTAVARPTGRVAELEEILTEAGYPSPSALITRLPASRLGVDLPFPPRSVVSLGELESALGPSGTTHSLDADGPAERYWDLRVGDTERVVVVAELDGTATSAVGVRLTPYSFDPEEE